MPEVSTSLSPEGIYTVTLHRPSRKNAVDGPTARALYAAFQQFEANDKALVAVLYGAGGAFCAGADLAEISAEPQGPGSVGKANPIEMPHGANGLGPMGPSRMQLSKPVIAAVEGYAVAGGLELALWCDMRVASEDAVFGVFCRRWGVPLIDGGTVRLPRLIGESRAMDLILTGRAVDAKEALHIGLANRIAPKGQALAKAQELALQISKFPQGCMRNDRQSCRESHAMPHDEAIANEFALGLSSVIAQAQKGAQVFKEQQRARAKM